MIYMKSPEGVVVDFPDMTKDAISTMEKCDWKQVDEESFDLYTGVQEKKLAVIAAKEAQAEALAISEALESSRGLTPEEKALEEAEAAKALEVTEAAKALEVAEAAKALEATKKNTKATKAK